MRSWNTTAHPDWIEPDTEFVHICESCYNVLNEFEQDDPIELDGQIFCDKCASDYIALKMPKKVSDMTHKLVLENAPTVSMVQFAHNHFGYNQEKIVASDFMKDIIKALG